MVYKMKSHIYLVGSIFSGSLRKNFEISKLISHGGHSSSATWLITPSHPTINLPNYYSFIWFLCNSAQRTLHYE